MNNVKILLIEPDTLIVKFLTKVFEKNGFIVVSAENGAKGLNQIRSEKFDLIIMEKNLPGMDDLELISEIQEISEYKNVPIIVNTTSILKDRDIKKYLEAGVVDCIIKPLPNIEFVEKVKNYLPKNY